MRAVIGFVLASAAALPAAAQLEVPCVAFQNQGNGQWTALQQITVNGLIGPVELMPGQPAGVDVARVLQAQCR